MLYFDTPDRPLTFDRLAFVVDKTEGTLQVSLKRGLGGSNGEVYSDRIHLPDELQTLPPGDALNAAKERFRKFFSDAGFLMEG
jgi:hypothetical protein